MLHRPTYIYTRRVIRGGCIYSPAQTSQPVHTEGDIASILTHSIATMSHIVHPFCEFYNYQKIHSSYILPVFAYRLLTPA
jgi:hypothetical protein